MNILTLPKVEIQETNQKGQYRDWADWFIREAVADNTKKAYVSDMKYFFAWQEHAFGQKFWPLNEEVVIQFIYEHLEEMPKCRKSKMLLLQQTKCEGTHALKTVRRRLMNLSISHQRSNHYDPVSYMKMKQLINAMSRTQPISKKCSPITKEILTKMLNLQIEDSLIYTRDKALISFAWSSGGRRRSEISNAIYENLISLNEGTYQYNIERSKTDQIGTGMLVPLKGQAAFYLTSWIKESKITSGYIFRSISKGGHIGSSISEEGINNIVKKRIKQAGYDPKEFSAHSLRRGFVTEAGKQGCPLGDVMRMTGHKSVAIAMGYYESGSIMNNLASDLF